jgi:hypothetical protein
MQNVQRRTSVRPISRIAILLVQMCDNESDTAFALIVKMTLRESVSDNNEDWLIVPPKIMDRTRKPPAYTDLAWTH